MPTYGYECNDCKDQFEVFQKMSDDALTVHEGCGGSLRRLLYPVGIVFKGPGFHVNDYAKKSSNGSGDAKIDSKPADSAKPADSTTSEKPAESSKSTESASKEPATATT